jgi:hypothetical protein
MSLFSDITNAQAAEAVLKLRDEVLRVRDAVVVKYMVMDRSAQERLAAVEATNVALSWVAERLKTLGNEIMP